jgi:hypothetical protein
MAGSYGTYLRRKPPHPEPAVSRRGRELFHGLVAEGRPLKRGDGGGPRSCEATVRASELCQALRSLDRRSSSARARRPIASSASVRASARGIRGRERPRQAAPSRISWILISHGEQEVRHGKASGNRRSRCGDVGHGALDVVPCSSPSLSLALPRCDFAHFPNFDADRSSLSAPHGSSPDVMRYGGNSSSMVRAACISAVAKPSVNRP